MLFPPLLADLDLEVLTRVANGGAGNEKCGETGDKSHTEVL
jgi:hypothetical protein